MSFDPGYEKQAEVVYYTNPFDNRLFKGLTDLLPQQVDAGRQHKVDVNILLSYPLVSELLEAELTEYRMVVSGLKGPAVAAASLAKLDRGEASATGTQVRPDFSNAFDGCRRPSPPSAHSFSDGQQARRRTSEKAQCYLSQNPWRVPLRRRSPDPNDARGFPAGQARPQKSREPVDSDAELEKLTAADVTWAARGSAPARRQCSQRGNDSGYLAAAAAAEHERSYGGSAGEASLSQFAASAAGRDREEAAVAFDSGISKLSVSSRIKSLSDPNLYSAWVQAVADAKEHNARFQAEETAGQAFAATGGHGGFPSRAFNASSAPESGVLGGHFLLPSSRIVSGSAYPLDNSSFRAVLSAAAAATSGSRLASRTPVSGGGVYHWPSSCWVYDDRQGRATAFYPGCQTPAYAHHTRVQYLPLSLQQVRNGMTSTAILAPSIRHYNVAQHANPVRYAHPLQRNYANFNPSLVSSVGCGTNILSFPVLGRSSVSVQPPKQPTYVQSYGKYATLGTGTAAAQMGNHIQINGQSYHDLFKTSRQNGSPYPSSEFSNSRSLYKPERYDVCAEAAALPEYSASAAQAFLALNRALSKELAESAPFTLDAHAPSQAPANQTGDAVPDTLNRGVQAGSKCVQAGNKSVLLDVADVETTFCEYVDLSEPSTVQCDLHEQPVVSAAPIDFSACNSDNFVEAHLNDCDAVLNGLSGSAEPLASDDASIETCEPVRLVSSVGGTSVVCPGDTSGTYPRALNFQTIRTKKGVVQRLTFGGGYC